MYYLQRSRVCQMQVDAGNARVVYLFEELSEGRSPFVVDIRFGDECCLKTGFQETETKIDVLAKTHVAISANCMECFRGYPHVEAAGIKSVHRLLLSPDAAGRKKRGHGIINCFLYRCKRG